MKKISFLSIAAFLATTMFLSSCQEDEETTTMNETILQEDVISAYFDDLLAETDEITYHDQTLKNGTETNDGLSGTRTVETSFAGDTVIHTITYVDFVNENSPNERTKNGNVVIKVMGRPWQETFWREVNLIDYFVNDAQVEGTKVIEKTADHSFTMILVNGKVTFENGSTYTREFNRSRTQVAGDDTPFFIWDDEFTHEGIASGININGEPYSRAVTEPLLKKRSCRWFVQGIVQITVGSENAVLDYGEGVCDDQATLTVNGETTTITLRNRFRN